MCYVVYNVGIPGVHDSTHSVGMQGCAVQTGSTLALVKVYMYIVLKYDKFPLVDLALNKLLLDS